MCLGCHAPPLQNEGNPKSLSLSSTLPPDRHAHGLASADQLPSPPQTLSTPFRTRAPPHHYCTTTHDTHQIASEHQCLPACSPPVGVHRTRPPTPSPKRPPGARSEPRGKAGLLRVALHLQAREGKGREGEPGLHGDARYGAPCQENAVHVLCGAIGALPPAFSQLPAAITTLCCTWAGRQSIKKALLEHKLLRSKGLYPPPLSLALPPSTSPPPLWCVRLSLSPKAGPVLPLPLPSPLAWPPSPKENASRRFSDKNSHTAGATGFMFGARSPSLWWGRGRDPARTRANAVTSCVASCRRKIESIEIN